MFPSSIRKTHRGVTIAEVLVASTILLLLSALFASLFNQARTSTEGGSARLEFRGIHRTAQERLTLILRSVMEPNEVDPALISPEYGKTVSSVLFHAPANLLDSSLVFEPRVPVYPKFLLERDPSSGSLIVQLADGTGSKQQIGRNFSSFEVERRDKHTLNILLTSTSWVKGASGGVKEVVETSRNLIRLQGIR